MKIIKKIIGVVLLGLVSLNSYSQLTPKVDSLIRLSTQVPDTLYDDICNEICWKIRNSHPDMAIQYAMKAITTAKKTNDNLQLVKAYSFIGVCHRNLGNYTDALDYYYHGLEKAQEFGVKDQEAYAHINLGNLFLYQENYDDAEDNLRQGLVIGNEIQDSSVISYCYLNLGRAYLGRHQIDLAQANLAKALEVRTLSHASQEEITVVRKYIGDVYLENGDNAQALSSYLECLKQKDCISDVDLQSNIYKKVSDIYINRNYLDSALYYGKESLNYAQKIGAKYRIKDAYENLAKIYYAQKEYQLASECYQNTIAYRDSVFPEQLTQKLFNIQYSSQIKKQESTISTLNEENDKLSEDKATQKKHINALVIFLAMGTLILILLFTNNKNTKKLNARLKSQNEEIESQNIELSNRSKEIAAKRDELEQQNEYIEKQRLVLIEQQKQITDSISYAKRIQNALFPDLNELNSFFSDWFLYYSPRDVVSGDFYWVLSDNDYLVFVVADCTGHGVPGAFMSMLGICALHEITGIGKERKPSQILENLRTMVKTLLHQNENENMPKDGMDISLIVVDKKSKVLEYSGANLPLLYIRNGQEYQLKPNRNPIGVYIKEKPFESQKLTLLKNDQIYLFSDGYASQFGGEHNMKLKLCGFRDLLLKSCSKPMAEQKEILENSFKKWKGDSAQIDDILVIGLKF
ncbi:MAG: tetratricopeptide repeat protein [Bacteroidales bacterium]|nr:tetratricopeptide repeat protein [Bacteroidales bacterium]